MPTKPDPERTAQEIAILRTELGLLEEGVGDLGEDGTPLEEAQAFVEAYVYGNTIDKVAYYLVLLGATCVALVSIIGAITNMTKFTKSSEVSVVDLSNSLEMPQMKYCSEFFSPQWRLEAVCVVDSLADKSDCFVPAGADSPPTDGVFTTSSPKKTVTLNEGGGLSGGMTYEGSLNPSAGTNKKGFPVTMTREIIVHDNGAYTEQYCVEADAWKPSGIDNNFVSTMAFQLVCNPNQESCNIDTDVKGVPTNTALDSPSFLGSIYVGDGPKQFVDMVSGDLVVSSLTKSQVEFTDEEGDKDTQVDFSADFNTMSTTFNPLDFYLGNGFVPTYRAADGTPGGSEVRVTKHFGFYSKLATAKVTKSTTVMVPVGDFGAFYAALGGASSTVALLLGICFGKFDVPKKDKKTGKSIDAYIGRWRRGPTHLAREMKQANISKICREHYGFEYTPGHSLKGPLKV